MEHAYLLNLIAGLCWLCYNTYQYIFFYILFNKYFIVSIIIIIIIIYTLPFQVIIPCIWIFSMIVNIPEFLVFNFDTENKVCAYFWPEEWMQKAYQSLKWNGMVALALLVMIVLYSIVVYTLWFKHNDDNTYRRRVSLHLPSRFRSIISHITIN